MGGGGGTVSALSLGDSGVTEHGVPRPLPSLVAASVPPIAASFFFPFFFFAGTTINAELIKPQLIASAGEREEDGEGGRERREGGAITALAFTDGRTEGRGLARRTCSLVMLNHHSEVGEASLFIQLFI